MIQPAALGGGLALFEDLPAPLHLDLVDGMTYQRTRDPRVSPAGDHDTLASQPRSGDIPEDLRARSPRRAVSERAEAALARRIRDLEHLNA
jgi:hypothetical protein